jgi:hypothetical protein
VSGADALRLRGLRLSPESPPFDADVSAGGLHFLQVDEALGTEILRVLAGDRDAAYGSATTLAGRIDLSTPGRRAVITILDAQELVAGRITHELLGVIAPARSGGAAADEVLRRRLAVLSAMEGRTILASGPAFAEPETPAAR